MRSRGLDDRQLLVRRLGDRRSGQVVFLSHCLLNENTRYLGGACRSCCVREIVQQCLDHDVGIVQMPCPEEKAWGGVLKRTMLQLYGPTDARPAWRRLGRALAPLALLWTRLVYRRLARRVAAQIDDYVASGFSVLGVVAVDGSPSCGLRKTVDIPAAMDAMAALDRRTVTVEQQNALVRRHARDGAGLFVAALREALRRRALDVPFLAHDLFAELEGRPSGVALAPSRPRA